MSKPIPKFYGKITNSKLHLEDIDSYNSYLLTLEDKRVELVVKKEEIARTNQQSRYLFGVVYELISEATGYTKEEVHEMMKSILLKDHKEVAGKRYTVIRSTHDLTTVEMGEYIENVKRFASTELQLNIPEASKISN